MAGRRVGSPLPPRGPSGLRDGVVVEVDVVPIGPYRLPLPSRDGLMRRTSRGLARLIHHGEVAVVVHAWVECGSVRLRSEARSREAARHGIERMRFALCLDHDLAPFHGRFRRDPVLGPLIRRRPWLRPRRRPEPFEALAWAVTEQLIEGGDAVAIQRRLIHRHGRSAAGLRDAPSPAALAARSPAELEGCGLSARRAIALVRASTEVAAGRVRLDQHEPAWRRLRAIRTIGSWTVECLALCGQGRDDQLPAGDLAYRKLVGRLEGLGRRATEDEVRAHFARYAPFQGLAGVYLLSGRSGLEAGLPPPWVRTARRFDGSRRAA